MTNTEHEQQANENSLLKEAAKAATIGAALGAALGAATASRHTSEGDAVKRAAVAEPEEADEQVDEPDEEEEDLEGPEEAEEPTGAEDAEEPVSESFEEPEALSEEQASPADDVEAPPGLEIVRTVQGQFQMLTGRVVEGTLGMQRDDGGWRITLEVVELPRIPSSTDVLAAYEVMVDNDGEIQEWRRTRRYVRSGSEEEGQ